MPGKRASSRAPPSKRGRTSKTRSSGTLLPLKQHTTTAKINAKRKKMSCVVGSHGLGQKVHDRDAREELDKHEMELRKELMPQQEQEPTALIVRKEAPKELAKSGSALAQALDGLAVATK
ncbi:BZ3500_MvSof-1268-A1-R1_Chr2-1g04555 [Microbotryum saponariae]|uniref:BZ3500_MvSof-1268-A1-R1_Chr2-1g04555 protein n=1 Tax=Microbotryum saponariae TaxID=289078 RepID=A0A2X0KR68_9BASI|nr:BZ3500_MvSof-1268-A1-R1_Chr2-1g04555 [Microbotryum saponariae]SCZ92013.1 BZ3501_MvSof-1269-A2-R1_Chr2-1g04211 [Microbotryum saponariae]